MKINHCVQVDLANPGLPPRLQATQDDSVSHVIDLHLKENGKPWPIPADATVLVHFRKSDRTGGVYDTLPDGSAAWQRAGNELCVTLAPQVTTAPGDTYVAITLVQGGSRLTLATLLLQVIPCPGFAGASESYSYVSAFMPQPADPQAGQMLRIREVNEQGIVTATESVASGLDAVAVTLLLSLLEKGVYTDDVSGELTALAERLGGEVAPVIIVSIDAVYVGGAIYAGTDVATLQNVIVTAHYSDGTKQQVKNFSLSGLIRQGENIITVIYNGCTDTITVTGIEQSGRYYNVYNNLSYVTNSNSATTVAPGGSYSCVIQAHDGYDLKRLLVTMGGEVVLEENYTTAPMSSGWSTDNATGDIIITATAQLRQAISHLSVIYAGGNVTEGTKLSELTGISVTVHYNDGTQQQLNGGYSLSGSIGVGTNVITVNYSGYETTFTVVGTELPATYTLTHNWDFTQSLTDTVSGVAATTNATHDASGISFTEVYQYINLLGEASILNKAIEIDIASGMLNEPTVHGRLFAVSTKDGMVSTRASCFTWRYNNSIGWTSYAGDVSGGWDASVDTTQYPLHFFHQKTLRLVFDSAGKLTAYYAPLGGTEFTKIHTWSIPWYFTTGAFIIGGPEGNDVKPITFSGVRIYEED